MTKNVYLLFKTDAWHSYSSRNLLCACDSKEKFETMLNTAKNKYHIADSDWETAKTQIRDYEQTQNLDSKYGFELEILVETMNCWIE